MKLFKSRTLIAVLGLFALLAVACGGGGEPTGIQDDAGPIEGETAPADTGGSPGALPTGAFGAACGAIPESGPGSAESMSQAPVATAASNNPVLSTLTTAVEAAGLTDTLNGLEGATVFAPSNEAFSKIPEDTLNALLNNPELLGTLLSYHVHTGDSYAAPELVQNAPIETIPENFDGVGISAMEDTLEVQAEASTAQVVCGNVQTANATVHIIDTVLLPAPPEALMGGGSTAAPTESTS